MTGQNVRHFISLISFYTLSIFFQYCFLVPFTCQSHCPLFYLFLPPSHKKSVLSRLILRPFIPSVPLSHSLSFPADLSSLLLATSTTNILPLLSSLSLIIKQVFVHIFLLSIPVLSFLLPSFIPISFSTPFISPTFHSLSPSILTIIAYPTGFLDCSDKNMLGLLPRVIRIR